jgi:hypothetical protein
MKQLEVQIMGQSYLLGCPAGGEQRLLEAVEKVDTAMCKIRDAGKVKAPRPASRCWPHESCIRPRRPARSGAARRELREQ